MRVEYLLPGVALSILASACGSDTGNVMGSGSNELDPALIDAALGPEPGGASESNLVAANEALPANEPPTEPSSEAPRRDPVAVERAANEPSGGEADPGEQSNIGEEAEIAE